MDRFDDISSRTMLKGTTLFYFVDSKWKIKFDVLFVKHFILIRYLYKMSEKETIRIVLYIKIRMKHFIFNDYK